MYINILFFIEKIITDPKTDPFQYNFVSLLYGNN